MRSDEAKERYIKEMTSFFNVDGILFHNARTCPNNSNSNYGMPQRLEKEIGIPSLTISDEQTETNIEAFIEQLEEHK